MRRDACSILTPHDDTKRTPGLPTHLRWRQSRVKICPALPVTFSFEWYHSMGMHSPAAQPLHVCLPQFVIFPAIPCPPQDSMGPCTVSLSASTSLHFPTPCLCRKLSVECRSILSLTQSLLFAAGCSTSSRGTGGASPRSQGWRGRRPGSGSAGFERRSQRRPVDGADAGAPTTKALYETRRLEKATTVLTRVIVISVKREWLSQGYYK